MRGGFFRANAWRSHENKAKCRHVINFSKKKKKRGDSGGDWGLGLAIVIIFVLFRFVKMGRNKEFFWGVLAHVYVGHKAKKIKFSFVVCRWCSLY